MEENDKKALGMNIKKIRKELKLTQEELAEELDINAQFLSQVENGKVGISVDNAIKICRLANCSPTYLFNGVIHHKSSEIGNKYELLNKKNKSIIDKMIELLLEMN